MLEKWRMEEKKKEVRKPFSQMLHGFTVQKLLNPLFYCYSSQWIITPVAGTGPKPVFVIPWKQQNLYLIWKIKSY